MMIGKHTIACFLLLTAAGSVFAQNTPKPQGGATELTPSKSEYFSWINNTNEGATEAQTLANLNFFKWLRDTYGMQLDIYAFDAGAIDGAKHYGSYRSDKFKRQFPRGFRPISEFAAGMNTSLGLWGGPDGFGDTPAEAAERADMMVDLVRNYNFRLFKMDAVCGQLRPEKYEYFNDMMNRVREIAPDFVLLNHRLKLGEGTKHSTTYLLGGAETYVDVLMTNSVTAPHHRANNISRENTKGLTRLSEDHGVCLSSSLDAWDDDLILQAFCRDLIMAPQLYGNPWFLRDDEFPYLAFIFNLHRDYRDILVNGQPLPEKQYGRNSVSRGDSGTRFITVRNLSWQTRTFTIDLDGSIGLEDNGRKVKARTYHPFIEDLGSHKFGSKIELTVDPYRVALVKLTNVPEKDNILISGIPYRIVNDRIGDVREVLLCGESGCDYEVRITKGAEAFRTAELDGAANRALLRGGKVRVHFDGDRLSLPVNRHIADLKECAIPEDMSALYYATVFAADNDCVEARCMRRSGPTSIPQVQAARDAFFNQEMYVRREIDSRNLFDGDLSTAFSIEQRWSGHYPDKTCFMLDLGESVSLDSLVFDSFDYYSIQPWKAYEGSFFYVSDDLKNWTKHPFIVNTHAILDCSLCGKFRYLRLSNSPLRICEVTGYAGGEKVNRGKWHANNLFRPYDTASTHPKKAWSASFKLDEVPSGAYLCVAINGNCGKDGAFASFRINGKPAGCPDRAPAYWANAWECRVNIRQGNYTYYFPLTGDMKGADIDAVVLSVAEDKACHDLDIKVYLSTSPESRSHRRLVLSR
ncbi:MAG: hypothetical protein MJY60_03230 [Bacteroidales bacterium]|nr:hypothetical protein [Bacteroidales bacterium]